MKDAIERDAERLLRRECPECGGEDGHETEEGWLRCGRCSDPHSVTRYQAMQAIIAALTPPEGYVLVPTRVLEDAHSFVRDKIHWEGGGRRLLGALSELVKMPSAS